MALAGPPVKSNTLQNADFGETYEGFIKVRLGHSVGRTVMVPDQIVIEHAGWRFYQPSFFGPCILGFDLEPGLHQGRFSADIGGPREDTPARIMITVRSDQILRRYEDGSHVFRCLIEGPSNIQRYSAGRCVPAEEGAFDLKLFHHTTPVNFPLIRKSGELWSSPWNLAGVRRLLNVAYAYLTSLEKVKDKQDLSRIAMASEGLIRFQTTSNRKREEVVQLEVYRDDTSGRTASLEMHVPWDLIAPAHLYFHLPASEPAYYEVVAPEIFRLGMLPEKKLRLEGKRLSAKNEDRKTFQYVVLGDTSSQEGIIAPYDEENTKMVAHLERFDGTDTLFDFWRANQNTDQMAGRSFEKIHVERGPA